MIWVICNFGKSHKILVKELSMTHHSVFDTRSFEQTTIQALIVTLFDGLREGASFQVITDNDPKPLHDQLDELQANNLSWEYLEKSTNQWRFKIEKTLDNKNPVKTPNECCGGCGG
jgi:uncharacterized protein (DUF2249 family)